MLISPATLTKLKSPFHVKPLLLTATLLFLLFFASQKSSYAQDIPEQEKVGLNKNIFHGGLGFAGIYISATINYERILTQNQNRFITGTFVKAGLGTFASLYDDGQYLFAQYGILTGKNAGHFEASAGPNFALTEYDHLPVAFSFGYRNQKPGKSFMFRTGLAYPESIYFGMGLSF